MIVMPSRFAGLKIVEDDFVADKVKAAKKTEVEKAKKTSADKNKKHVAKNSQIIQRPGTSIAPTNGHSEKKKKKKSSNNVQWEEWKQKDEEIADEKFNDDLILALQLSRVEYGSQPNDGGFVISPEQQKHEIKEPTKKNKKNKPLTFGQFSELCQSENHEKEGLMNSTIFNHSSVDSFESDISMELDRKSVSEKKRLEVDSVLKKDKEKGKREKHLERIPPSLADIKRIQLDSSLAEKDKEIDRLKEIIDKIGEELGIVKVRNKKLCNIIGQGEMKDKATLLLEIEEGKELRIELNKEVEGLNALLQQERSRCTCSHRQDKRIKKEKKSIS